MEKEKTLVAIAIREFALPVPRTGSIEPHSGYGRAAMEGQEIHLLVQAQRKAAHSDYQAELPLVAELEWDTFRFRIGGRADGFFPGEPPRIEEIKTAFQAGELVRKLSQSDSEHPYLLQLRTYGYFYWLAHGVLPELSFHLVSTRTGLGQDLAIPFDLEVYERWKAKRLEELADEARRSLKRVARRKKTAARFEFPFERPRPSQTELIREVETGLEQSQRMLIQAPTGLGKTAGVLYPVLKEALARGQKAVYVTPKNSQHSVAEDAIERFRDKGAKVKSLTLTAKSKLCFKNEPLCNPDYCEYARDHFTKVHRHGIAEQLAKKRKLTARVFRELGETFQVCPYELQGMAAREVDTVIGDYNYVFSPRATTGFLGTGSIGESGRPSLVIDEAHNLLSRAMDYFSPALSSGVLEAMRPAIRELPTTFRADAENCLNDCLAAVAANRPDGVDRPCRITPLPEIFLEQEAALRAFLSRYLDSQVEILPRDVVLRLCFYWAEFSSALELATAPDRDEFFVTFRPDSTGGTVKITCCDASALLEKCYDEFEQVVAFSATLKPFDYYAKLSGLKPETLKLAEFGSPFPRGRRKLLIIPQISTKYSDRERSYPRVAEAIAKIVAVRPGNYFAFFPSFAFLERVAGLFRPPEGFTVLKQVRDMKASAIQEFLDHLRGVVAPTVIFAVQGGVFSEGVDYPGEMVVGAFVVGPPLPSFDLEREEMREFYERHYGAGFDYAYTYPAMAKAVQAAGRVIRSETDRGLIVLMDNRFIQPSYAQSMPSDWFTDNPRELVSSAILAEVASFWKEE